MGTQLNSQQVRFFDLSEVSHHNITMRMYHTSLRKSHNGCRNQTMATDSMPMHLPFNVSWSNVSLSDHVPLSLATAVPCREAASNKTMAPILTSNTTTTPTQYPHVNLMVPYLAMAAAFLAFILYVVFSPFQYAREVVLALKHSKHHGYNLTRIAFVSHHVDHLFL
jgi:microcystin-dependent protein